MPLVLVVFGESFYSFHVPSFLSANPFSQYRLSKYFGVLLERFSYYLGMLLSFLSG